MSACLVGMPRGHTPDLRENSVLFSLRELRHIETSRIQEEHQAAVRAEQLRLAAKQQHEQREREAAQARIASEREAQLRIEQAREAAEREARLRIAQAEAAERQRHEAALHDRRLHEEMLLRRESVAKQRPTWMVAVMSLSLIAVVAMVAFALVQMSESDASQRARDQALREADNAKQLARAAAESAGRLEQESADLSRRIGDAIRKVNDATTEAARVDAKRRLLELEKAQQAKLNAIRDAKARADLKERTDGIRIDKQCAEGVLCAPGK
ncbi:MAG: hypothetical protein AB7O24_13020 [Kofleriaceae bacterium]